MHFYSFLCEAVFGKRPAKIRLMYLKTGETIETVPSAQSVKFITTRTTAVWSAVERACITGDFRPRAEQPVQLLLVQAVVPVVRRRSVARRGRGGRRLRRAPRNAGRRLSMEPLPVEAADASTPGQSHLGPGVDAFDQRVDELLERLRGHPAADGLFLAASHLGDFSLIWHIIGITRGVVRRKPDEVVDSGSAPRRREPDRQSGCQAAVPTRSSDGTGDDRLPVRQPKTSSFPSGHASSATFAAMILTSWDGRRLGRAVVRDRRDRRHQPCVRSHPPRLRRGRRGDRRHGPRPDRPAGAAALSPARPLTRRATDHVL